MRRSIRSQRARGFTIVEAILVVAILGIAAGFLMPALGEMIRVTKMTGVTRENGGKLRQARFEAIKRSVPVRVSFDLIENQIMAFADVHGENLDDPPNGELNEIAGQPRGTTDYVIWRQEMPSGIDLMPVDGFTGVDQEIVFLPSGSVEDAGAVRFGDPYGNRLEVRITTQSAARIEVLKWDGTAYRSQGEGGSAWRWN